MSKKITSVFLLLCLLAPGPLLFTYLEYQKKMVRKSVKWKMIEGIDKDELVLLAFTPQQKEELLNWKHNREFEYAGEMYDIVEQFTRNDTHFYYCWWDKEETLLNRKLDRLLADMSGADPQKNKDNARWTLLFKSLYRPQSETSTQSVLTKKITHFFFYSFSVKTSLYPPSPPPPEFG